MLITYLDCVIDKKRPVFCGEREEVLKNTSARCFLCFLGQKRKVSAFVSLTSTPISHWAAEWSPSARTAIFPPKKNREKTYNCHILTMTYPTSCHPLLPRCTPPRPAGRLRNHEVPKNERNIELKSGELFLLYTCSLTTATNGTAASTMITHAAQAAAASAARRAALSGRRVSIVAEAEEEAE